jgi:hypothetical protein
MRADEQSVKDSRACVYPMSRVQGLKQCRERTGGRNLLREAMWRMLWVD